MGTNEETGESLIVTDDLLVRYLLGELEESDRIRIQELSFSDDELFDRLLDAENDLIDRYATGELSGPERERFERSVLPRESTGQRLIFAGALGGACASAQRAAAGNAAEIAAQPPFRSSGKTAWYWLAAAAALLVMVGFVASLMLQRRQPLPAQTAQSGAPSEQQSPTSAPLPNPSVDSNNPAEHPPTAQPGADRGDRSGPEAGSSPLSPPAVATFVLSPGSTRSDEQTQILTIKSGTRQIRLHLQLDPADEYGSYGFVLRTAQGNEIWKKSGLLPGRFAFGKAVTVEAPALRLAPGQYEVELTGRQGAAPDTIVNYYTFTIAKSAPAPM